MNLLRLLVSTTLLLFTVGLHAQTEKSLFCPSVNKVKYNAVDSDTYYMSAVNSERKMFYSLLHSACKGFECGGTRVITLHALDKEVSYYDAELKRLHCSYLATHPGVMKRGSNNVELINDGGY